jgi:hypothetical protein
VTGDLLKAVADALTALERLGARPVIRHGALLTDHGYVVPNEDGSWSACLKVADPDWVAVGDPEDD